MNKREQRRIINEMCKAQRAHMLERLPRIPEHWDGHELRAWFMLAAQYGYGHRMMDRKRMREFNSDVYQNNL